MIHSLFMQILTISNEYAITSTKCDYTVGFEFLLAVVFGIRTVVALYLVRMLRGYNALVLRMN